MVELLGVWFLDESDLLYIILSADLLSGGQRRVSPTLSGVYLVPSILSQLFLAIGAGGMGKYVYPPGIMGVTDDQIVGRLGYYLPFSHFSVVLIAISNGLLSKFAPGTSTGKWIGYQTLLGAGSRAGLQMVGSTLLFRPCPCSAASADR